MIKLYQFNRLWGLPNVSPFCMKVETFLRMTKLSYHIRPLNNPLKSPKGKLPYIKDDGQAIADSELILNYLTEKYHIQLDSHLSDEQKSIAFLLSQVYSEHLYWIQLYFRWQYEPNWERIKKDMFGHLPWLARIFVPKLVRKRVKASLKAQGVGRYSLEEVIHDAKETLENITFYLKQYDYTISNQLSSVDASSFAFLSNLIWTPLDDPLTKYAKHNQVIKNYCERMQENCFPDIQPEFN